MKLFEPAALVAFALAYGACNGGVGTPSDGVQFSGARNGTASWSGRASFWLEDGNRALTTMSVSIPIDGDSMSVRADFGSAGEPTTGTFQSSGSDPTCYATVQEVLSGAMWSADANLGNRECHFTFTSVRFVSEETTTRGRRRTYEIHGNFSASLTPTPATRASGSIEMSGSF